MGIDYVTNPTGLFYRAGKPVKAINSYRAIAATTFATDLATIVAPWEAAGYGAQVASLYAQYAGWQRQIVTIRQTLARVVDKAFTDPATVLSQLPGLQASDPVSVAVALYAQMVSDSQTVLANTVTIGAASAGAANAGTGKLLLTKLLDGTQPPALTAQPNAAYAGRNAELALNETMNFTCVADSFGGGAAAGAEVWTWSGGIPDVRLGYGTPGSGSGPSLQVVAGDNDGHTQNGSFDYWPGGVLGTWTLTGSPVIESTTVLRAGGNSLKIPNGIPVTAIQTPSGLRSRRCYCLSVWAFAAAGMTGGTLTFGLSGTGFAPLGGGGISQALGSLPAATWTLLSAFVVLPASLPSNLALSLAASPAGAALYLDDAHLVDATYHGGIGAVLVAGGSDFAAGDTFAAGVSNDNGGVFQSFFGNWYGIQLPSSGSPTISDSLAS